MLTQTNLKSLFRLIESTQTDASNCSECFEQMAEFSENVLRGRQLDDALKLVQRHIQQCYCCNEEFEALKTALAETK